MLPQTLGQRWLSAVCWLGNYHLFDSVYVCMTAVQSHKRVTASYWSGDLLGFVSEQYGCCFHGSPPLRYVSCARQRTPPPHHPPITHSSYSSLANTIHFQFEIIINVLVTSFWFIFIKWIISKGYCQVFETFVNMKTIQKKHKKHQISKKKKSGLGLDPPSHFRVFLGFFNLTKPLMTSDL